MQKHKVFKKKALPKTKIVFRDSSSDEEEDHPMNGDGNQTSRHQPHPKPRPEDSKDEYEAFDEGVNDIDSDPDSGSDGDDGHKTKGGWADAMARLVTNDTKGILAKARLDRDIVNKVAPTHPEEEKGLKKKPIKKDYGFEVVKRSGETVLVTNDPDEDEDGTNDDAANGKEGIEKKDTFNSEIRHALVTQIHKKIDDYDKVKEGKLNAIATKGVVHLFNAVSQQHQLVKTELKKAGGSERKRDQIIHRIAKAENLDTFVEGDDDGDIMDIDSGDECDREDVKRKKKRQRKGDQPKQDSGWKDVFKDHVQPPKLTDWDKEDD